jgi:SAM-dependent methyltransferase
MLRADGRRHRLPVSRWMGAPDRADGVLLDACRGATVDVGCGPGRLTAALTARAVVALGIDTSATAVRMARRKGAAALRRSVFDPLPGESRWRHALVADGNIGIGGNPSALLRRLAALLAPGGTVLVETEPPGAGIRQEHVRLIRADAPAGPSFRWAWVAADAMDSLAYAAGLVPRWSRSCDDRWFAELERQ